MLKRTLVVCASVLALVLPTTAATISLPHEPHALDLTPGLVDEGPRPHPNRNRPARLPQSSTPTFSQLQVQYNRAKANGWLKHFAAAEKKYGLPTGTLLGLGSRETNLSNVLGSTGGWGVFQIDQDYHADALEAHGAGPSTGEMPPIRWASMFAARYLATNYVRAIEDGIPARKARRAAIASYNAGYGGMFSGWKYRHNMDIYTTHGDYSRDVQSRIRTFRGLLAAEPVPGVKRPTIELDARGLVSSHGGQSPYRIVLHSTESPNYIGTQDLYGIASYWRRQGDGLGAHLTIDGDGLTALNINERELGYHTYRRNTNSLGIEQIGYAKWTRAEWMSHPAQLRKVAQWLAYWSKEFDIPLSRNVEHGVSTHNDQSQLIGGGHWDPGPGYPFDYVLSLAREYKKTGW